MTTYERNPQAAVANRSSQLPTYKVIVTGIDMTKASDPHSDPRGIANTVDTFAKMRQIGVSMVVGSGAYPQVGETWIINQALGSWTFLSRQVAIQPEVLDFLSTVQALQQLGLVNYTGPPTETVQDDLTVLGNLTISNLTFSGPPLVTTGSTVQSWTDGTGEVWIAKNGVNGGNWSRARDTLWARWYRTASFTSVTTTGVYVPDTRENDAYGLYNGSPNFQFVAPITGRYEFHSITGVTATATTQNLQVRIYKNTPSGTLVAFGSMHASSNNFLTCECNTTVMMSASDTVACYYMTNVALVGMSGEGVSNHTFRYTGTG